MKVLVLLSLAIAVIAAQAARIHRRLQQEIDNGNTKLNVIVAYKQGHQHILNEPRDSRQGPITNAEKVEIIDRMAANSQKIQQRTEQILNSLAERSAHKPRLERFWITSQVFIADATPELINSLKELDEVDQIYSNVIDDWGFETPRKVVRQGRSGSIQSYGISKVGADQVWEAGNNGNGSIVGIIDTGVNANHAAIKGNFRKEYGWFDGVEKQTQPYDDVGHGSHVVGTIAGSNGIGVAPGAQWIMCKGIPGHRAAAGIEGLIRCGEWMACPTDASGENKDCSRAPHIVSNSWGLMSSWGHPRTFYDDVIASWRKFEIIPVFAAGNEGRRSCNTLRFPGTQDDVITVAASDENDKLAPFSSRSSAKQGERIKPDISGPGVDIISVDYQSNDGLTSMSGTSMATPHVAGVIALMKTAAGSRLKFDHVFEALTSTAVREVHVSSNEKQCGEIANDAIPNVLFGYGRMDAVAAVKQLSGSKPPSTTTVKPNPTTGNPTIKPTGNPTVKPTENPTVKPTVNPTVKPTGKPTLRPTKEPKPTEEPLPTDEPFPTEEPIEEPPSSPEDPDFDPDDEPWFRRN